MFLSAASVSLVINAVASSYTVRVAVRLLDSPNDAVNLAAPCKLPHT